jgi:dynein heavy chain
MITGAIHLKLGAAPAGPAGTGKTESSKDLAKAMGTFCVVFNCSDQVDYVLLGRLFSGLAQCGCWCCLDEFNRIQIEVLSVVAQQLLVLRNGMKAGKERIDFEGRNIGLLSHCVIVTMNPGYAGRTALPDNLKVCFRPVAMMVPFYALISEIVLYSQGFTTARVLSIKMAALYQLASQQLSQQPHYDYGLRAIISVLLMAGGNKRKNPDLGEDVILIRAMRDSNLPKFLAEDVPLFLAILVDLFPGVDVPTDDYGDLMVAITNEIHDSGLQQMDAQIAKIIQLHDMIKIRFGVTIVGPTGGGKSVAWEIMTRAHSRLRAEEHPDEWYQNSRVTVINPKSITMGELYGENNDLTQEWTDGLGSTIVREQVKEDTPDRLYIMFDGPIDTLWIESLNTVLDDNRMLCLANGERIRLKDLGAGPSEMRMLFEVNDLAQASPATVSRLGVVYYDAADVGWEPFVKSWLPRVLHDKIMSPDMRAHLWLRFETTLNKGLIWQQKYGTEPILTYPVQIARSLCSMFQILYYRAIGGVQNENGSTHPASNEKMIDKLYSFAYIWSVGGSLGGSDDHEKFDDFCTSDVLGDFGLNFGRDGVFGSFVETEEDWEVRKNQDEQIVLHKEKLQQEAEENGSAKKLKKGQVHDFSTGITLGESPNCNGDFRSWKLVVPRFEFDPSVQFFSLFVPTIDTVRYSFLMELAYDAMSPVFFTGITGTGKSAIAISLLNSLSKTIEGDTSEKKTVLPVPINFSGQTMSKLVQSTIEAKLEKKRKDLVGAPVGKNVVLFIDDVNMPIKEEYGAQPPIELLRHLICHKFLYDRDKLFLKHVKDTVVFAAAAPPGGGRAEMTGRFSSRFHMLCVPPASEDVLFTIFSSILGGFFSKNNFSDSVSSTKESIVNCTIKVYSQISQDLRPTPTKSHYTFNLRDVAKVFQGVLMVKPKEAAMPKSIVGLWMHEW